MLWAFCELYIWRCNTLNIFKIISEVLFIKIFFLLFLTFQISHSVDHVCILNGNLSHTPKVNMLSCLEVLREMYLVQALSRQQSHHQTRDFASFMNFPLYEFFHSVFLLNDLLFRYCYVLSTLLGMLSLISLTPHNNR